VSLLATADYLEGVLVLAHCLRKSGTPYPLTVLVAANLPGDVDDALTSHGIRVERVDPLPNPQGDYFPHWNHTYSKLHVFGLTQFAKIVYLDADMLVCANLDELFDRPHLSAVNSGSRLPEYADWVDMNSGLLVIEPDRAEYDRMLQTIGRLPVRDHSEQSFLHCFYPDWPTRHDLHLDHRFNMFHIHLDRYAAIHGYHTADDTDPTRSASADPTMVAVIHFIGPWKPWHRDVPSPVGVLSREPPLQRRATKLWRSRQRDASR